jgi:diguanylate cyclase (GGDEF)-like protein
MYCLSRFQSQVQIPRYHWANKMNATFRTSLSQTHSCGVHLSNKMKILVVEDSTTVTKILKHLSKQYPAIETLFASTFAQGRALYQQNKGEIFAAVVDLHLPDAPDGETVDHFLTLHIPVIVLTGNYSEMKRDQLLSKGIVDYIVKESVFSYNYVFKLVERLNKNQEIKILVAEDSKSVMLFIETLLQRQLYQVLTAQNGLEALDQLKANDDIKLLITDYHMPEMNGVQLVQNIRRNIDKSNLVIIGLSGENNGSLSAKFIKNGANDFLQKPFFHEELSCRVMHNIEELELIETIRESANRDFLTELYNRRYLFDKGGVLHTQATQKNTPLAVAVLDVDHFKKVNDSYGHRAGDTVLTILAKDLSSLFNRFLTARMGGEEFCIVMPGLNNSQALTLLDKFRSRLANKIIEIDNDEVETDSVPIRITISAGVTNLLYGRLDHQVNFADQLLFRAKEAGRNIVMGDDID